jgi:DNA integrity scanning protein DisA with diadenylate cyclase activity
MYNKSRYFYQDFKVNRRTHLFELGETTQKERVEIQELTAKLGNDNFLKEYIKNYYQEPREDGQVEVEYLIHRCDNIASAEATRKSWEAIK